MHCYNKSPKSVLCLAATLLLLAISSCAAFAPLSHGAASAVRQSTIRHAVVTINDEGSFDKTVSSNKMVVIDYSTTWCGPCKVIAPKFDELSGKYPQAIFAKVIGDASPEASKLMKREGVRSVPSFHYFVNGEKVDVVNGANAEAIEAAITKHVNTAAA
jgi:thioredoxin 1